ncbi:TorCAD operon transcriptional regulatory protein TorR [BD1-7 clade bacterium]|uniref:TorCAD operon transcriptional regulatory protein TorR n=1 Tax=BD1-7 clade bacterium TaxID=2029982 RepID=A0A5S9N683_9GAMM|nr:TorCAD operon transcriptional regulatory protein TorR [BD1-7 clade bacterium]
MSVPSRHILIIDDDQMLTSFVNEYLSEGGYISHVASSAAAALQMVALQKIDLVVLDLGLPDEDGLVLLRRWQKNLTIPIFVVSARDDAETRVAALEMGAADYLVKPFNPREFMLRLANLLPSADRAAAPNVQDVALSNDPALSIDLYHRTVTYGDDQQLVLTRAEFDVLACLANQPGRAVSRDELLDASHFQGETVNASSLGVLIHRIRKKLGSIVGSQELIATVSGVGYRLLPVVEK